MVYYYNKLKDLLLIIKKYEKDKLKDIINFENYSLKEPINNDNDDYYKKLLEQNLILLYDYLFNSDTSINIDVFLYQLHTLYNAKNKVYLPSNNFSKINVNNPKYKYLIELLEKKKYLETYKEKNKKNIKKYKTIEDINPLLKKKKIETEELIKSAKNKKEYKIYEEEEKEYKKIYKTNKIIPIKNKENPKYKKLIELFDVTKIKNKYINKNNMKKKNNIYIGGNETVKTVNSNPNDLIKELYKKINELNSDIFLTNIIVMMMFILSNKINEIKDKETLIQFQNYYRFVPELFFIDVTFKGANIFLLIDMFKKNNGDMLNYVIKDEYTRDIIKKMNINEILERDSIFGNKINSTKENKYIFIYTLIKILKLEFNLFIEYINRSYEYEAQLQYIIEQVVLNLNTIISMIKKINIINIESIYNTIFKETNEKNKDILLILRFRANKYPFNHRYSITKSSDYQKDIFPYIKHIDDLLGPSGIGNNIQLTINYMNENLPKGPFNLEKALFFNKLKNISNILKKSPETLTISGFFDSIYHPDKSLKEIGIDPKIIFLKEKLKQNTNVIIFGFGQSGVGKTSFLLGYDYKGLNEGIVDQIVTLDSIKEFIIMEYYLNKEQKPNTKKTQIDINTLKKYAGKNDNLKNKVGLLLLKFLEGDLNIDNPEHIVNKKIRSTPNNKESSRSHTVIIGVLKNGSNLIICDLAGVENKFNCNNTTVINFFKKIDELYIKKKKNKKNLTFYNFVLSYDWFRSLGIDINDSKKLEEEYNANYELIKKKIYTLQEDLIIKDSEIKNLKEELYKKKITKLFFLKKRKYDKKNFNIIIKYLLQFVKGKKNIDLINRLSESYKKEKWWKFLKDALPSYDNTIDYDKIELGKKQLKELENKIKELETKKEKTKIVINSILWKHIIIVCKFSTAEGKQIINKVLEDLEEDLSTILNDQKIDISGKKISPIYNNSLPINCDPKPFESFYTSTKEKQKYKSKIFNDFLPRNGNKNIVAIFGVFDLRMVDFNGTPRNFPPSIPYIDIKKMLNVNKEKPKKEVAKIITEYVVKKYPSYLPPNIMKIIENTDESFSTIINYIHRLNLLTAIGVLTTIIKIKSGSQCSKPNLVINSKPNLLSLNKKYYKDLKKLHNSNNVEDYYNKYIKYKKKYYDLKYKHN